jgi:RHS repeat-associated protein
MLRHYQEYHPFGSTSYELHTNDSEVSLKRYQYVGKERDGESGLYYYGARYYADWLCRFVSVDPLKDDYPYYTTYQYAGNKPVSFIDLDGLETTSNENTNVPVNGQEENELSVDLPPTHVTYLSFMDFDGARDMIWGAEMDQKTINRLKYHYFRLLSLQGQFPHVGNQIIENSLNDLKEAYLSHDFKVLKKHLDSYQNFYSKGEAEFGIFIQEIGGNITAAQMGVIRIDFLIQKNPNFVQGNAESSVTMYLSTKGVKDKWLSAGLSIGLSFISGKVKGEFDDDLLSKIISDFFVKLNENSDVELSINGMPLRGILEGNKAGINLMGLNFGVELLESTDDITYNSKVSFGFSFGKSPFKSIGVDVEVDDKYLNVIERSDNNTPTKSDTIKAFYRQKFF